MQVEGFLNRHDQLEEGGAAVIESIVKAVESIGFRSWAYRIVNTAGSVLLLPQDAVSVQLVLLHSSCWCKHEYNKDRLLGRSASSGTCCAWPCCKAPCEQRRRHVLIAGPGVHARRSSISKPFFPPACC